MTPSQVLRLEEAGLNALPALRTVFDGAWVVRIARGGSMKRANSVTCLDPADSNDAAARVQRIEALYRRFNLRPTFRMTPLTPPALGQALTDRGYHDEDERVVLRAELTPPLRGGRDSLPAEPPAGWFQVLATSMSAARLTEVEECLTLLALPSFYVLLEHEGHPACCARVTIEGDLAGVFDVATIPAARRAGLARQAMFEAMAAAAGRGARTALLQLPVANHAALGLYRSLGFTEAYRYRFRVPR